MKKLLVLSVLLGLMALPMFATHVSIDMGGDLTFGFMGDFGDEESETTDLTWDVMVGLDDFNAFTWSLKDLELAPFVALDKALVTTDIGKWLALPLGLKVMWGYDDPDANEFGSVSGYDNQIYDFSPAEYWGVDFLASWNFVELEVAFDPGVATSLADAGSLLIGLALKEPVAGLNAEVYWFQGGVAATDAFDVGKLGVGAAYDMAFGDLSLKPGISFQYDMDSATVNAWAYGLGVKAVYKMIEATVDVLGDDAVSAFHFLRPTVMVSPIDKASIYAGMILNFDSAADLFNSADLGLKLNVGIVDIFLGYLITSDGTGEWNAPDVDTPAAMLDGGMYLKFDVDY